MLRAQTLALRNQDYVESARVIGERKPRIIVFEIVPNLLPILAASFIFTVIYGLGVYVALCYLGVVSPASASPGAPCSQTAQSNGAHRARLVVVVPAARALRRRWSASAWPCSTSASTRSSTPG